MPKAAPDDDLLKPTLDERYDSATVAAGGAAPWDPESMVFATFFSLPLGAGVLYAINYRRLGQPRAALFTLLGTCVFVLGALAGAWWLTVDGAKATRPYVRLALTALGFITVTLLSRHQKGPFRAWSNAGGEARSITLAAVLAFVGNVLAFILLAALAVWLTDGSK